MQSLRNGFTSTSTDLVRTKRLVVDRIGGTSSDGEAKQPDVVQGAAGDAVAN